MVLILMINKKVHPMDIAEGRFRRRNVAALKT
jgi:hypothetical protein